MSQVVKMDAGQASPKRTRRTSALAWLSWALLGGGLEVRALVQYR